MTGELDGETRERFASDGVVCLRNAIPPEWLDVLARGIERNLASPGPYAKEYTAEGGTGRFFGDYRNWPRIPEYEDFIRNGPAAAIAGRLMASRTARFFHEHVLVKEPGTRETTPWHHDAPYYCVDGQQTVSLWIPLDPVARENGIEFVRGSHRSGAWYKPKRFTDGEDHARGDDGAVPPPDVEANREAFDLVSWELAPGDLVAFSFLTLHGARGNPGQTRRRAFSARFVGDDATFADRPGFISPPFPEVELPHGARLDHPLFPVLWAA